MPLPRVYKVVQDSLGNVVPLVLCSVYNQGTGVLATLWQDDAGTVPLSNPMTSNAQYGSFAFYAAPGHFDLTFVKPGYTFETIYDMQVPQDDLTLGTLAQQDANAVAITGGIVQGLSLLGVAGKSELVGNVGVGIGGQDTVQLSIRHRRDLAHHGISLRAVGNDGSGLTMEFLNVNGNPVGSIFCSGVGTAYQTASDARLKHAIATLAGTLDVIRALRPVAFRWRANDSKGQGFLAHEVQAVVPEAVTGHPDAVDDEGQMVPQGMDASKLVPYLVGACQELAAQVQSLTVRLATLEGAG